MESKDLHMTEVLHGGEYLRLMRRNGWEYVEHITSAIIVSCLALTSTEEIVLVEQHRPPVGAHTLELPSGLLAHDESPVEAVKRELFEETGFAAKTQPTLLSSSPLSAGLSSCSVELYVMTDVERLAVGGGIEDEKIEVLLIPLEDVRLLRSRLSKNILIDWRIFAAMYLLGIEGSSLGTG